MSTLTQRIMMGLVLSQDYHDPSFAILPVRHPKQKMTGFETA